MANFCSLCGASVQSSDKFCTGCGENIDKSNVNSSKGFANKRAKVLDEKKQKNKMPFIAVAAIISLGLWSYVQSLPDKTNPIIEAQPVVVSPINYSAKNIQMSVIRAKIKDGKIKIPFEVVKKHKFVTFTYNSPSGSLPLLAYISNEGKLITAVSMCEPCNSTRFHINGEKLICNSCGSTWELNNLNAVSGACGDFPPDVIPNKIVGDEIQIDEAVVAGWQRRI
ncbi:MAG: Fe-S-containing protein [Calditrichia bacterium]